MPATSSKELIKNLLGQVPFTAELYWLLRQQGKKPIQNRFSMRGLQSLMPEIVEQVKTNRLSITSPRNIFMFATLHFWIEHTALMGMTLATQGHNVSFGFLPYADWRLPINRFDLRRQNAYARKVLEQAEPFMKIVPFLNHNSSYKMLPRDLMDSVEEVSTFDSQYTLQIEDVTTDSDIYRLRLERNQQAARTALLYFQNNRPDVVIVPNGMIQELGVIFRVARHLKIPVVSYEFSDERQHIWISQNSEVMRHNTDSLWKTRQNYQLTQEQTERLQSLLKARRSGTKYDNFIRQWQDTPTLGAGETRTALGLDQRPVILLATNVLGDSLTLGRNLFSRSNAEWISRSVQYFAGRPDVQFIIRVHPGEVLTHGLSMAEVVHDVLPKLPEHIRLIGPKEKMNTYDLADIADVGLVYSTTVGLEMAMNGKPVIVAGKTHFRGRGFTYDPDSWVSYFKMLKQILADPQGNRLSQNQKDNAWRYAYRFFFEFPRPYPWHLVHMWEDYQTRPLSYVLGEGWKNYKSTFDILIGEPIDWDAIIDAEN